MTQYKILFFITIFFSIFFSILAKAEGISKSQLGELLFFDKNLSHNKTQSCASCHNPKKAFIDDRKNSQIVSLGDDEKSIGSRNTPTLSYINFNPEFQEITNKESNNNTSTQKEYIGGFFYDGRAKSLTEQAGQPILNPLEMAMKDKSTVINRIRQNPLYLQEFKSIYGKQIFDNNEKTYQALTESIAEFQSKDKTFAPFDSKYDRFLKDEYELTVLEDLGRSLFFSNNNTSCSNCHLLKKEDDKKETFTNYKYENIGIPVNMVLKNLQEKNNKKGYKIDKGLLENPIITHSQFAGKFKTPTLRNIAITAPYMHNGIFQELKTVILFYDQFNNDDRIINPETGKAWQLAEIEENINFDLLKSKILTDRKVDALIAFLKTLTDKRYEHLLEK